MKSTVELGNVRDTVISVTGNNYCGIINILNEEFSLLYTGVPGNVTLHG